MVSPPATPPLLPSIVVVTIVDVTLCYSVVWWVPVWRGLSQFVVGVCCEHPISSTTMDAILMTPPYHRGRRHILVVTRDTSTASVLTLLDVFCYVLTAVTRFVDIRCAT